MVLPERFELSTSPLPRECSTPELRQHLARPGTGYASAWRPGSLQIWDASAGPDRRGRPE